MTTKVSLIGLRQVLKRLMNTVKDKCDDCCNCNKQSDELFLWREDGNFLKLWVVKNDPIKDENPCAYDVVVSWHDEIEQYEDDCNYELDFSNAMNRYYNTHGHSTMTLAFMTEDCTFVYDNEKDAIPKIHSKLAKLLDQTLCYCEKNIISDGHLVCYTCMMNLTEEDLDKHKCGICLNECLAPITKTTCCGQYIHKACVSKCKKKCPYCRSEKYV